MIPHAHYDDEQSDTDRDDVIRGNTAKVRIRVVNPSSNLNSARKCIELSKKFDILVLR